MYNEIKSMNKDLASCCSYYQPFELSDLVTWEDSADVVDTSTKEPFLDDASAWLGDVHFVVCGVSSWCCSNASVSSCQPLYFPQYSRLVYNSLIIFHRLLQFFLLPTDMIPGILKIYIDLIKKHLWCFSEITTNAFSFFEKLLDVFTWSHWETELVVD